MIKQKSSSWKALILWSLVASSVYGITNILLLRFGFFELGQGHFLLAATAAFIAILSLFTLVTGVFQWSTWTVSLFGALILASLTTNLTSIYLGNAGVSRADIVWMWAEADHLGDVILVFGRKAIVPFAVGLFSVAFLWWAARQLSSPLRNVLGEHNFRRLRTMSTVGFGIILTSYGFALPIGPAESNLYAFGLYAASLSGAKETALSIVPNVRPYRKIVILVDESVRADIFQSQVADKLPADSVNLGTALSTANCSASSNAAMRWGVLRSEIGVATDLRANPSLWQFAKRAGFRTVLIDNQSNGKHQNFLSQEELAAVDSFVPAQDGIDTDIHLVESLRGHLNTSQPELIYVVMRGSHFPYFGNLPRLPKYNNLTRLEGYIDSVAYAAGGFFSRLNTPEFHALDVLVLYTSDHGQLFAGGSTHCSSEYRVDEYLVPMVAMGGGPLLDSIRMAKSCNFNRSDHQGLRSTALLAMGYSGEDLERMGYFPPLTACIGTVGAARLRGKLPWVTAKGETLDLSLWNGGARLPETQPPK